jgi:non-heme chloroperoxidase
LLKQLGESRPILVGASMGGTTSLVAVGEGRVDARGIVLLDVAPRVEAGGIERIRTFMRENPEGYDSLEEVADAIARFRPDRPRPVDNAGLVKNVRRGSDGKLYWHWDPRVRRDGPPGARTARLNDCVSRISVPTLLVRGLHSDVVSEAGARDFVERCPGARCVTVPGTGHMAPGDANDDFCDAMVAFLQEALTEADSKVGGDR